MHAEIAGAGFAGLVAATALAARGWSVRVHEKTPALRAEGFGLSMQENMLKVLETLGVRDEVVAGGERIRERLVLDARGRTVMASGGGTGGNAFGYRVSRRHIIEVLSQRARRAGVEIVTESIATGAEPAGILRASGQEFAADLVIAADGIHSAVRDSLGIPIERRLRADGAMRVLVPKPPAAIDPSVPGVTRETWCGRRRFIVSHTRPDELYVAMSCLAADAEGRAVPLDVATWSRTFPNLRRFFEWMSARADWSAVRWVRFQTLRLARWHAGKVAIVGDAAHAMPPDLGQGAGCAMMNALSLAVHAPDLSKWESMERPLTEHTQRWAAIYGAAAGLPGPLRTLAFGAMGRVKWLHNSYQRTARHIPTGYLERGNAG